MNTLFNYMLLQAGTSDKGLKKAFFSFLVGLPFVMVLPTVGIIKLIRRK